jgi:hypothetical protein
MNPTESTTNADAKKTGTTVNTGSTTIPHVSTCPHCQGTLASVGESTCPLCNKPLPAWWLAWSKTQQPPTQDREHTTRAAKSDRTDQASPPPITAQLPISAGVPSALDHRAEIVEHSYTAYLVQLRLVRGLGYVFAIIAGITFILFAAFLNSLANRGSYAIGLYEAGLYAGTGPIFVGSFLFAFFCFLFANILEMKIADTKNIVFMAKRANETQQIQAQVLQILARDNLR